MHNHFTNKYHIDKELLHLDLSFCGLITNRGGPRTGLPKIIITRNHFVNLGYINVIAKYFYKKNRIYFYVREYDQRMRFQIWRNILSILLYLERRD